MWPRAAWKRLYEPRIRAMAGLGSRTRRCPIRIATRSRYAHCDVLVIGAGPAGLAAALAAAECGAQVMLCDEQAELGGSLLAAGDSTIDGKPAARLARRNARGALATRQRRAAAAHDGVRLLPAQHGRPRRTGDRSSRRSRTDLPRERLWQVRAKEVVIAAGAIERPLVFPGNDRPGIMLADAARTYAALRGASGHARCRCRPRTMALIAPRWSLRRAASRSPLSPMCALVPDGPCRRGALRPGCRSGLPRR